MSITEEELMAVHRVGLVYRVRRKSDGLLYSHKAPYTKPGELVFSTNGRVWARKCHAVLIKSIRHLDDCEVVEYETVELGVVA